MRQRHNSSFIMFLLRIILSILCLAPPREGTTVYKKFSQSELKWESSNSSEVLPTANLDHCMISGIQLDKHGTIYVTVPRWKNNIPATLNILNQVNYTLDPYLSLSMQREGVSGDLQNAKAIHIDSKSRMWIMEVGRRNYLMPNTNDHVTGQGGVWIIDMNPVISDDDNNDSPSGSNNGAPTGNVASKFYFPTSVVSASSGLLASMAVDEYNNIAYFSDAGDGGIVVYYLVNVTSRRIEDTVHNTMVGDLSYSIGGVMEYFKTSFEITSGIPFPALSLTGIAKDSAFLYFTALQSNKLYRVKISKLLDLSLSVNDLSESIEYIGKKSASDAIFIRGNTMYYSSLPESTYYSLPLALLVDRDKLDTNPLNSTLLVGNFSEIECYNGQCYNTSTLENLNRVVNKDFATRHRIPAAANVWNMRWINSFASDYNDPGKLWMVSNHFDMFVTGSLDSTSHSMAIVYDYPSYISAPGDVCTLEELFEDWLQPPHTVVAVMAIGAASLFVLELLFVGSCYIWVKHQLKIEEEAKLKKNRDQLMNRRMELAGMNTTVVHHPGGVSIGYHDLDKSSHSLNSNSIQSSRSHNTPSRNVTNTDKDSASQNSPNKSKRSSRGSQDNGPRVYDVENTLPFPAFDPKNNSNNSKNDYDNDDARTNDTWRDKASPLRRPASPSPKASKAPSMVSSFAPDLLDGFSSLWHSPNSRYKGKSKSLRSTDYLQNPNVSHSGPSTPVSSRRKYYRNDEDLIRRDRSASWGNETRRSRDNYAPTQTSFAPPPERKDLFSYQRDRSQSKSNSSRSKSQSSGDSREKTRDRKSSGRSRELQGVGIPRQRSFSADDIADSFEMIQ